MLPMPGKYYQTVFLTNYGTQNPFTVTSSGLVLVGNVVVGQTVSNSGTIASPNGGVQLGATLINTGRISGSSYGVNGGTLIANYGAIVGTSGAGVNLASGETLVNGGTISVPSGV